jgi:uncharacterized membrane protein YqjE
MIAPILATFALGAILVLIVMNFDSLVGGDVGAAPFIVVALYVVMGLIGFIVALRMKQKRSADWSAIGTGGIQVIGDLEYEAAVK